MSAPEKARVDSGPTSVGGIGGRSSEGEPSNNGIPTGGPSQAHSEVIRNLATLFDSRKDDLDLAIMKVIAEGGSPSAWLAGMLRMSAPSAPEQPPKPRFLGE